jgi:hypothetical protein
MKNRRGLWRQRPLRRLAEAHRRMEEGNYAEAAERFFDLAVRARRRRLPVASQLLLQAGRAYAAAGETGAAEQCLLDGFGMMSARNDPRLGPVSRRVLDQLRADGHTELADTADASLRLQPDQASSPPDTSPPSSQPGLPAKCPYCGGNIHLDQVDYSDPGRPSCAYCGSPLLGE